MIILVWEALGFNLAYHKGQQGGTVVWIGGQITITPTGVMGTIKQSIIDDIKSDLQKFMKSNVIANDALLTFVSRLNFAAGLLVILRPFLQSLWAALNAKDETTPPGTTWTKRVKHALSWLNAFFQGDVAGLQRHLSLEAYTRQGDIIEVGTDASPWGMGGWISVNGSIIEDYSSPISNDDTQILEFAVGDSDGQQIWEALSILVALRLWKQRTLDRRASLCIRGDNVGALVLICKMRPASAKQAIIAREIALEFAASAFIPDVVHTPGIANVIADALSRTSAPGYATSVTHIALTHSVLRTPQTRNRQWYKSLEEF